MWAAIPAKLGDDRRPKRRLEMVLVNLGDPHQQVVVGVASDRGDDAEDQAPGLVQVREVSGDEIRQNGRDGLTGEVGIDELGREERIALPASQDLVDERERRPGPGQRLDPRRDLVTSESAEVDAVHGRQPDQLSQPATLLGVRG